MQLLVRGPMFVVAITLLVRQVAAARCRGPHLVDHRVAELGRLH